MTERARAPLRRGSVKDRYLVIASLACLAWAACSLLWSGQAITLSSPFLIFPLALLLGTVVGRWQSTHAAQWLTLALSAMLGLVVLVAIPFYANAQAALGVQLVALTGLVLLAGAPPTASAPTRLPRRLGAGNLAIAVISVGVLGVLLAARSQAASLLIVPVAVLSMVAVLRRTGPMRHVVSTIGLLAIGGAAIAVIALGSLTRWPEAMNASESLSSARHRLWSDALELWRAHPFIGGGPGSFAQYSELAASTPHLARVHSSILQVGSELGIVGAVLFLGVLMAGTAVAAQGSRAQALIGVAAWSGLAIHSMIDHLYEFPVVTLVAGVVLGWAGRTVPADPGTSARDVA